MKGRAARALIMSLLAVAVAIPARANSTNVLAVYGHVTVNGMPVFGGDTVRVTNLRTHVIEEALVATDGTGSYSVAFVDFTRNDAARDGDTLRFHVSDQALSDDSSHVVSSADVLSRELRHDLRIGSTTAVGGLPAHTAELRLYPNPARAAVRISCAGATHENAVVDIMDVHGRRVRRLDMTFEGNGWSMARWNLVDETGQTAPSGLYFVSVSRHTRRLVLVR